MRNNNFHCNYFNKKMFFALWSLLRKKYSSSIISSCRLSIFSLKRTVSRDFLSLVFFHQTIPLGPPIHGLKRFRIWFCICRDIRLQKKIYLRLRAIQLSVKFKPKIVLPTPHYVSYSMESWLRSICITAQSHLYLRISQRSCNHIQNDLTLILTTWKFKKPFFCKNENESWMA
jgi:hypothetical protein